jgi:hypothetical protein
MGPIYNGMTIEGATIRVKLAHTGGGLSKRDLIFFEGNNNLAVGASTLSASADGAAPFEIAGADNVYHRADAVISTNGTVVVSAPGVTAPKNVRYGIESASGVKTPLYNTNDLPASMFRSETWAGLGSATAVAPAVEKLTAKPLIPSMTCMVRNGRVVLPRGIAPYAHTVALYNVKGSLVGQMPVEANGMVSMDRGLLGEQLMIVRVR